MSQERDSCEEKDWGKSMTQVMVLGLGDIVQRDRGLGIHAVRDLYREQWSRQVRFVDRMMLGSSPLGLEGIDWLLVLNAWQTGMPPGTLTRVSLGQVLSQPGLVSEPALWRGLALADVLGQDVRVVFLGLEAKETTYDFMFSRTIQLAYPQFLIAVREEIACMLGQANEDAAPVHDAVMA
jgi:hydrogenase maturation protease